MALPPSACMCAEANTSKMPRDRIVAVEALCLPRRTASQRKESPLPSLTKSHQTPNILVGHLLHPLLTNFEDPILTPTPLRVSLHCATRAWNMEPCP